MTIQELIGDQEFTSNQRNELFIAYDESPQGFERLHKRAASANNPEAALISMVRKGQHLKAEPADKSAKPPHDTLDELVSIALRAYNARHAKYGSEDIYYGAWVASTWNGRYSQDAIAAGLRKRLALPAEDDAPVSAPPELVERMRVQAGRIGQMPEKLEPAPEVDTRTLAERLIASLGREAA